MSESTIKVVLLGSTMVGKTSIVRKEMTGGFDREEAPTIGACFTTKSIEVQDQLVKIQIWDTAGQERFRSLAPMYYHNADSALLVYSIDNSASFDDLEQWVEELRKNMNPLPRLWVIGNKSDLEDQRAVSVPDAEEFAKRIGADFLETSAKTGANIDTLFISVADKSREAGTCETLDTGIDVNDTTKAEKGCC